MNDETTSAAALQAPFPTADIHQRPGRGGKTYDYIDARSAMDRLDEVYGPEGWGDSYRLINEGTCAVECTITVLTANGPVGKTDIGYPNSAADADSPETEPLKAGYSDAFKRAAVKWGIGRFLYKHDSGTAPPRTAPGNRPSAPSSPAQPGGMATEKQIKYLAMLLDQHGFAAPAGLDSLPRADASAWIEALKANGADARLTDSRTGEAVARIASPAEASYKPAFQTGAQITGSAKPATDNQKATIAKLSRLLGRPEPAYQSMTVAEAVELTASLSTEYNTTHGKK